MSDDSDLVTSSTQLPAGVPAAPGIPSSSVSEPQLPGHLVSTRSRDLRNPVKLLFIHTAGKCIKTHYGKIFSYNDHRHAIDDCFGESPEVTLQEHGWFSDENMFQQIAKNHTAPNGLDPDATFIGWRDSLFAFLDAHHGGVGGQWTRIT
ncbi:hypothetical protein HBI47_093620 [Parastagonospora nodorum]|nr:hypothetical protein HBI47_093620 [Parastagonospora nodorum]